MALATTALPPSLRRPVPSAQTLASLGLPSGGRLAVAVGAACPGRFGRHLYDLSEVPWERRPPGSTRPSRCGGPGGTAVSVVCW
ncbi:hypothetical protein [Streptomyces alanosinicus]|uniref:Uncharacterized protein n=1 Tax=Streptomyces alanosinicus TaxID=68171 RepID=A0A918YJM8_9ACTN|nr:hypothetical protein [Streptomyces alanosinicus]GHE05213.1 hypothetical protein GCM10010339_40130 [Streptomyces alanosinicus]